MTDVTPLIKSDRMVVQSYGPAGFKISGVHYGGAVIVLPDRVLEWDGENLDILREIADSFDVVLLGTGKTLSLPARAVREALKAAGIRPEPMDTGAACRAYNALMADGRRIAAALKTI